MKLFWFSKIGTKDSFSRLAESILPILKEKEYKLYTIVPPGLNGQWSKMFEEVQTMGQDIREGGLYLKEDEFMSPLVRNVGSQMKYVLLQVLAKCREKKIDYLMITMGVYEAEIFMETIQAVRSSSYNFLLDGLKVVVYVPFDYIPLNRECIKNILESDIFITTIPVDFPFNVNKTIEYVGHGMGEEFKMYERKVVLEQLNKIKFWEGEVLKEDEIIILNANLYGKRKRIDITIKAFEYVVSKFPELKLRLWLHGSYSPELKIESTIINKIIKSSKIETSQLNLVYNACQIGLQTSWGEGWSLTNCEHNDLGGIQVVPKWLACGYHFNNGYEVIKEQIKNEGGHKVTIGTPNQQSVNKYLEIAINKLLKGNYKILPLCYTWKKEVAKLDHILKKNKKTTC